MGKPVRISDSLYDAAKKINRVEHRSIVNQIEYWAMIGKCALDNPDLPIEFIKNLLIAKHEESEPFVLRKKKEHA